ncbi:MAG: hypothetical protein HC914_03720 [Chloroflexaceae bacterium]|nr:hypothetical protein [Chloroflexaceae bacterium]
MMTTPKLIVYVGLLVGMLASVIGLAITMPTVPHILIALAFLVGFLPLICAAFRLHRERDQ